MSEHIPRRINHFQAHEIGMIKFIFIRKGGQPVAWVKNWGIWRTLRAYFPVSLVKTVDLAPDRRYLFVSHPHGVISVGVSTNFLANGNLFAQLFPGIDLRVLTLNVLFRVPFYREYLLAVGLCDASRESVRYNLNRGPGSSVLLVVGGAQEALDAHPGTNDLTLANRKGFVKVRSKKRPNPPSLPWPTTLGMRARTVSPGQIALSEGAALVPVYTFGETDVYRQVSNPHGSRLRYAATRACKRADLGHETRAHHDCPAPGPLVAAPFKTGCKRPCRFQRPSFTGVASSTTKSACCRAAGPW